MTHPCSSLPWAPRPLVLMCLLLLLLVLLVRALAHTRLPSHLSGRHGLLPGHGSARARPAPCRPPSAAGIHPRPHAVTGWWLRWMGPGRRQRRGCHWLEGPAHHGHRSGHQAVPSHGGVCVRVGLAHPPVAYGQRCVFCVCPEYIRCSRGYLHHVCVRACVAQDSKPQSPVAGHFVPGATPTHPTWDELQFLLVSCVVIVLHGAATAGAYAPPPRDPATHPAAYPHQKRSHAVVASASSSPFSLLPSCPCGSFHLAAPCTTLPRPR
jgi:hypothetical protein